MFTPRQLLDSLVRRPLPTRFWVAYSGGVDSHVLLHALVALRPHLHEVDVRAVHVNHGLNARAGEWARHCAAVCAQLDVPCDVVDVDAKAAPGESPEAAARAARYAALALLVQSGDCLLTAHHQDDQAETLLLQLLRGSGPHGLAAMPPCVAFADGCLMRPLLAFTRADLQRYAQLERLAWVDDPSNADTGFDRNYLRQVVLPSLKQRWPSAAVTLSRSAELCADAAQLIDAMAAVDVAAARLDPQGLSVQALRGLAPARARNALRYWIQGLALPLPHRAHLSHILHDVLNADADAEPLVTWPGCEVRRYRDQLLGMRPMAAIDVERCWDWAGQTPLQLDNIGILGGAIVQGEGIALGRVERQPLRVQFRRGGERCRPAGHTHSHMLKKLLQEWGVPPWERARIPLIYAGENLVAVAGWCVCEGYAASAGEPGLRLSWRPLGSEPSGSV